ncbi:MAG: Gfo/Idh/MocA family oxidoreductase, partial [Phycisphaeraceae bacterium]|nr:Gfo/Idh/MocA family oxidoreductase [Phycisphaeraceae bacterium]
ADLVDAVVIATPHTFHPPLSAAALRKGVHVLSEKPLGVTVAACRKALDVADEHPELKFAVMYQFRSAPRWQHAKKLIDGGHIGRINRAVWTATNWFRSQAYYDSGAWRATWKGEGGGVLMNQCPHNLDMLIWLLGQPERVTARLNFGRYHDIEVEDDATLLLDYPDNATALFIASTGEAPGEDRLTIIGDKGRIVAEAGKPLVIDTCESSIRTYSDTTSQRMRGPELTHSEVVTPGGASHQTIIENFVAAILDDEPLLAPAAEAIAQVEVANAAVMSAVEDRPVDLPTDAEAYEKLLQKLIDDAGN